jgi:hypothetical protein
MCYSWLTIEDNQSPVVRLKKCTIVVRSLVHSHAMNYIIDAVGSSFPRS